MKEVSRRCLPTKELADIFAEESENDRTFYGFSESELGENISPDEAEDQPVLAKPQSKRSSSTQPFRLRVALRSRTRRAGPRLPTDDEDSEEEERVLEASVIMKIKKEKHVQFEDGEKAVDRLSPSEEQGSGSGDESFLANRAQNIKANKAMLAQLMADLQKMQGGAGFLKKQTGKQPKEKSSRPPRSGGGSDPRRNPERTSRRQTRSMGSCEDAAASQEKHLELSLEEELLEVRRAPQRRGNPRPNSTKPHLVRPVEDITEDELSLVAENMTEKVYNRVTGSTCHQCRQKTVDTKTCCRNEECRGIQGQFCGPCLRNRYGEDVRKALLDPEWQCPPCRGICNCSFCRARDGRCPTGILFPLAQYHGFSDVHSYLLSLRNKLKEGDDDAADEADE